MFCLKFNCNIISTLFLLVVLTYCAKNIAAKTTDLNDILLSKEPKIVGGSPIQITEVKYQTSLRLKANEKFGFGRGHICGGSVITSRVVLTAAHCIAIEVSTTKFTYRSASEFTVVFGSSALYTYDNNTLQSGVQQLLPHEQFNLTTLVNDIAFLFLTTLIPAVWPTVAVISLNQQMIAANVQCSVTGWGKMDNGQISSVLRVGYVPIVSNQVCSTNYGQIPNSMLCAGFMTSGGIDACQGDSGGPLKCNNQLVGIVSWGYGCGEVGYPGIYTNVSNYYDWIVKTNSTLDYDNFNGVAGVFGKQSRLVVWITISLSILMSYILRH